MNNYSHPGNQREFVAPSGGVTSGTPVKIQDLVVIPAVTAAEDATFNALVKGVVRGVAKATGATWTAGQKLYWDDSAKKFTTTSGGNTLIGTAAAAATSDATTGDVALDGVAR